MNSYETKQAARRARLEARAARLAAEGKATIAAADRMASVIPFGQPILVGHHSEGRDRRYRARIHDKLSKGFALDTAAKEVARRADSVGTGGISSDDPDAPDKLAAQLAALEARQEIMRKANPLFRKKDRPALLALGLSESVVDLRLAGDFCGRIGFAGYELQNNGANIRRIQARIAALSANVGRASNETIVGSVTIRQDADANRVMLIFPDKPPAVTRLLLKSSGFRWSPTNGAWQRHLNNAGIAAAEAIAAKLAGTP